jgi:hypothetical protein
MLFGAPPPPPEWRIAFVPVPEEEVPRLALRFRKVLAEPLPPVPPEVSAKLRPGTVLSAPPLVAQIDVPGYPPLHLRLNRFGQSAAMATWIHRMTVEVGTGRRGGHVQAVSLYLTRIDRDADHCAVSACRSLRSVSGKPLPMDARGYEKVMADPDPLAVQIFCQSLARLDPSLRCGFLALGAAFFGARGVTSEADS